MNSLKTIKVSLLSLFVLVFLTWVVSGSLRTTEGKENPNLTDWVTDGSWLYSGGQISAEPQTAPKENACATCHEDVVKKFSTTVHGKTSNSKAEDGSTSCTTCHGDGTAHMEGGGDISKIKNPGKLRPNEVNQTCTSCHSQIGDHAIWRGSKHESAGLSCLSCHSSHHAGQGQPKAIANFGDVANETKLLKMRSERETCYQCHGDLRKAEAQRSTHLFKNESGQARMNCSSCHNAHGSTAAKLMKSSSLNDTCYTCHTEKRGPFLWEHAPATENCANCHSSHGSNHQALLKARVPMLCQSCHIQGRHQTVAGKPNSVFMSNRGCLNCHAQVHGSNHPSGINLTR